MPKVKMEKRLKENIIESLLRNEQIYNEPYLSFKGITYSRKDLAEEIEKESEIGLQLITNCILLSLDMFAREKRKLPETWVFQWGSLHGVFIEEIEFTNYQEMVRYMKFHKDFMAENSTRPSYWQKCFKS